MNLEFETSRSANFYINTRLSIIAVVKLSQNICGTSTNSYTTSYKKNYRLYRKIINKCNIFYRFYREQISR